MEPDSRRISVWICQEEKLISGLSRRTTCSDVVRALLEDGGAAGKDRPRKGGGGLLGGPPHSYCIVEKWRGFERILPGKTRLLRLWAAWGDERGNVRFVLVRSDASLPHAGPRSAQARVVPSKDGPRLGPPGTPGTPASPAPASRPGPGPALSQERQRRVVRKAFRKLARINRRRRRQGPAGPGPEREQNREERAPAPSPCSSSSCTSSSSSSGASTAPGPEAAASTAAGERMETLVHLVLSQDHTLRQQVQRLRELDREIDRYEARVHLDRVRRHGANYVQDTYLDGAGSGAEARPEVEAEAAGPGAAELRRLQERRAEQEELLERLAAELQDELNRRWMRRRRREACGGGAPRADGLPDGDLLLEEQERLQTQLSASLYIGLRLNTDLEAVRADLDSSRRRRDAKERELQDLLDALHALDPGDEPAPGPRRDPPRRDPPRRDPQREPERAPERAPAKEGDDEDSDTGLSSMHSQDSDSVPVSESLV
ncbi:ras association domain-containing protein 10 [Ornithorhynchus anatinus]|uniref:ras association domain-containing protein 10 n=1 Tax=Ornithorhynchus anatinus TaxID=9258 RepID=UPI0010A8FC3A|nr:ras association domain-containing protein 10 [Ornithorhynchus anatinus]